MVQMGEINVGYFYLEKVNDNVFLSNGTGVLSRWQGRGIGKYCVKMRDELVSGLNGREIIAWIAEENIASINMYQKNGYVKQDEYEYRFMAAYNKNLKFYKYVKYLK